MSSGDLELLDLLYTATDDDEPRLKVGDAFSGQGVGQDCAMLTADGFVGLPNPPDAGGACGQGLVATLGNDRIVLASADGRYNDKAGTLAPGDRAVVSNCDAFLKLSQAGNSLTLGSTGSQFAVSSNSVNGSTSGGATMGLTSSYASLAFLPTGVNAEFNMSATGIELIFSTAGGPLCSITLTAAGVLAIVAPGGVTVNTIPLVVP